MNDFERCLNVLLDAGVEFVIIGGVAGAAHGSASVTYDLDVCYDRSSANIRRLIEALSPYHPRLRGAPDNLPFHFDVPTLTRGLNFTLVTDLGDLDVFGEVAGVGSYRDVRASSEALELFGRPCLVLSLEGLIRSKRASRRTKDLLVLPELEALRETTPELGDQASNLARGHDKKRKRRQSRRKS